MQLIELEKQKIAIWGQGKEGKAVAKFLSEKKINFSFIDDKEKNLEKFSFIFKSPGVSLYKPEISLARKKGVFFSSATNLFLAQIKQLKKRPFLIAVTGTKGKSTTSYMIAHILSSLGYKTFLGGNFGTPILEALDNIQNYDFIVAEISSYQAADLKYGFDASLLNNLFPEHLNWHLSHENYYRDKLNLLALTPMNIVNAADPKTLEMTKKIKTIPFNIPEGFHIKNNCIYKKNIKFLDKKIPLLGYHNLSNLCGALTMIYNLGLNLNYNKILKAIDAFKPLPHRLQIFEKNNQWFVDDSISTTPETAIAALDVFSDKKITLIAGGFERGQNYQKLAEKIYDNNVKLVAIPNTGKRIASEVRKLGGEVYEVDNMELAVSKAKQITPIGGVILLSPAAPSYGVYKNFEERGNTFVSLI